MAHYAQIDPENDNVVIRVSVVDDINQMNIDCEEDEEMGERYLRKIHGVGTRWIKTSYSGRIRGRFAGIGMKYDATLNEFVDPQPYPSWVYNSEAGVWEAPTPRPDNGADDHSWEWNEETKTWDREEQ